MYKSPFLSSIYDEVMRHRYAKRTIETYLHWIKNYIVFHNKQHPRLLGDSDVEAYLDHLVLKRNVTLAKELKEGLELQIRGVENFLARGFTNPIYNGVWLPHTLRHKYVAASKSLAWQYLFPSDRLSSAPEDHQMRRHHISALAI